MLGAIDRHYLPSFDQAVASLQAALKASPSSMATWEALADAYLARGSFSAARKAFERVLVLKPGALYPRLMIAGVKLRTGQQREAAADYRQISNFLSFRNNIIQGNFTLPS